MIVSPGGPEANALKDRPYDLLYISTICSSGTAVLAFDDPGTGQSSGNKRKTSLSESKEQLLAWADRLRAQETILAGKVGYLGISEGALVAVRAAVDDPKTSCLLYISGPHDLGWMMCRAWQTRLSLLLGDDPTAEDPLPAKPLISLARRALIDDQPMQDEAADETLKSILTLGVRTRGSDREVREALVAAYTQFRAEVRTSSWFTKDPDEQLALAGSRHVPILVIAGTRDERIPIRTVERTKRILSSLESVSFFLPEASHSLVDFGDPLSDHPYDPCQLISPAVLKAVSDFVVASSKNKVRH
jgi:pimeloyl-ACP methyl ester carboxylesterase